MQSALAGSWSSRLLAAVACAAAAGAGGLPLFSRAVRAAAPGVQIGRDSYSPPNLTAKVGDTVTWTDQDADPSQAHTVTSRGGGNALRSPALTHGQTWSHSFSSPGTYPYYCAIHPDMHASVTVSP